MSPCVPFRSKDGLVTGFMCGPRPRRKPCQVFWKDGRVCERPGDFQCDGQKPDGKTCDRHVCKEHALHVGHNRDLCPSCARENKPEPARDPATMPKRLKRQP